MQYDPIKRILGNAFNKKPILRKLFYNLLDLLLLRAWHIHKELKVWAKTASKSPIIFDAGMGFGQYSYFMSSMFPTSKIVAVDVKEEQVEDCTRFFNSIDRTNAEFSVDDLTKFKKHNLFDLALSVDVMEHIEEDVLVFKNICESLKPGGMLLISTPSDQGGSDVHDSGESSFIEEHVRDGYNINEIREKILSAGFSKVECRYSYGWPGKISWRISMKYPILMLGASKLFFVFLPLYYLVFFPIAYILNWLDTAINHHTGTGLIVKAWK